MYDTYSEKESPSHALGDLQSAAARLVADLCQADERLGRKVHSMYFSTDRSPLLVSRMPPKIRQVPISDGFEPFAPDSERRSLGWQ